MELKIDGLHIHAHPSETLLDMVKQLGLDGSSLSTRPLAAKIAGEVFNLNYVPVRLQDTQQERPSIRRAIAASKGEIKLIRYNDPAGKDVYDIYPLDTQIEDWKTQFNLTDKTLKQAEDSLARTTKIVGEGLQEVNAYLKSLPPVK